ncbi:MAG TPA: TetR/AcrR family transcriptional regulator [Micromonosporaceae bacterium]|nr:TetR/AcrR family transcriptional regulator [Micromonosporaceae bacterium]
MTASPRRRAQPGERRAEILTAARGVFAERGYRGASLAAVAERVGLTQQGVLHYFPSKDALLIEVLRQRDQDKSTVPHEPAGLHDVERLVAFNATQPGIVQSFTVLSAESVTDNHPAKPFFVERYRGVRARIAEAIRDELGDELPAGLTAEGAASLLIAVMDGLQVQWLLSPDELDMAPLVGQFVALLRGPSR